MLGCGEANIGERQALPRRNSRKSHGEERKVRAVETWEHSLGLVAPRHEFQALCSAQTYRASVWEPVVQEELVGLTVYLRLANFQRNMTDRSWVHLYGMRGPSSPQNHFLQSRKNHVSGFFDVASKASLSSFQDPSFWQTRSTRDRGRPLHLYNVGLHTHSYSLENFLFTIILSIHCQEVNSISVKSRDNLSPEKKGPSFLPNANP